MDGCQAMWMMECHTHRQGTPEQCGLVMLQSCKDVASMAPEPHLGHR